jgi:myo-inositol 2-dehydrogenase/D-chiro-inositol 1-dehydrogenase
MTKVALIGAGRMGAIHARSAALHPELELAKIVDPVPETARAMATQYGAELATLDGVLTDETIEGVIIASSTDTHLDLTLKCVAAGKAVFCEKPIDLDLGRARNAAPQLTARGVRLLVAFNRRFDPHFQALKAKVSAGDIGTLETAHIVNHDPALPPPAFIPRSGGLFKDFTIHDFDMARWLFEEEPQSVFASASAIIAPWIAEAGDVDTAKVILRMPSGKMCTISNSRRSGYGYDQRIELFGSKGLARAGNAVNTTVSMWRNSGETADRIPFAFIDRYAEAYRREMDHFADIVAGRCAPLVSYGDSVAVLALAEAAAESMRRKTAIEV